MTESNFLFYILQLYENLIVDIEHRINPLSLAEIAVVIVVQIKGEFCFHFTVINPKCLLGCNGDQISVIFGYG